MGCGGRGKNSSSKDKNKAKGKGQQNDGKVGGMVAARVAKARAA